jgi:hypothetical protein
MHPETTRLTALLTFAEPALEADTQEAPRAHLRRRLKGFDTPWSGSPIKDIDRADLNLPPTHA